MPEDHDPDVIVRVVTIVTLGVILVTAVIGLTVVGVMTDRDLFRAEAMTFGGVALVAALGGVSWWTARRHHWRVRVEHNGDDETKGDPNAQDR